MRLILVATDGSEGAGRAVDMAAALAKATAARLLVTTVGDNFARDGVEELARSEGGLGEALELIANDILQRSRQRALAQGVPAVEVQVGWGDPAEAIMQMAQRLEADLILVGRRGRGRLAGLLLGSVSQKLVSLAPCAVVVVP
jgi:nucleotide-binding universal stress UspA family protein